MNAAFRADAECRLAGGTRIVLELGEYRESEDVGLLCASRDGCRMLRPTVRETCLGDVFAGPLPPSREVRVDRCGVRTFLPRRRPPEAGDRAEGRIAIGGEDVPGIPVRGLDRASCCAESYVTIADRGAEDAMFEPFDGWRPTRSSSFRPPVTSASSVPRRKSALADSLRALQARPRFMKEGPGYEESSGT